MLLTEDIGDKTVMLQCRDDLEPQAGEILGELKRNFASQSERLKHGFKVQFGWSVLCLMERAPGLVLCEPNFRGNPLAEWNDDVSTTLVVLTQQVSFLRSIALPASDAVDVRFDDKIVLSKGCLSDQRIYLDRKKVSRGRPGLLDDSGWYIGPVPPPEQPQYQAMRVYQLLDLRPAALAVLGLPPGFAVIFDGNSIEGIQGPGGRDEPPWRLDS